MPRSSSFSAPIPLLCAVALALAGCGSSSDSTTTNPASVAVTTTSLTAAPDAKQSAEQAVRADLPDAPIWKDIKLRATVVSDDQICVDRILSKKNAEAVGGLRKSHVTVTFPAMTIGEPQDGTCADSSDTGQPSATQTTEQKASPSDKKIVAARSFYLRMDDYAIALDDAVHAAQDGEPGAAGRIAALRAKILRRLNAYLLAGNDSSVGGNLLLSAATTARDSVSDVARLAKVRADIADARSKLADEAVG